MKFHKTHGLSNDFVIIDGREERVSLNCEQIKGLADRRTGIGFDQLVIMRLAESPKADVFMDMYNADGSSIGACGNASRCVASLLMQEKDVDTLVLQTKAGLLQSRAASKDRTNITVDMGEPGLDWKDIPLAEERNTLNLIISEDNLSNPDAVSMGNPHCIFFVDDVENIDIETIGPRIENHELFPERTNVEFVAVKGPQKLRMRVWERGTGVTAACGSGACAAVVAAVRRGLTRRQCEAELDGGVLNIFWSEEDNRVYMTGPAAYVFEGKLYL
jgi:diaminopimelate epimerase